MSNARRVAASVLGAALLVAPSASADPLTGPLIRPARSRPAFPRSHPALCSQLRPVCVHAPDSRTAPSLQPFLADLESAAVRVGSVLQWPAPLPDARRGGSSDFDVFLEPLQQSAVAVDPDLPLDTDFFDRTSAFARVDPRLTGCMRRSALAEAYARAGLFAIDAAADHAIAAASAAYVASIAEACDGAFLAAIDDYQAQPWAAVSRQDIAGGRGAMLLPWFMQARHGIPETVDLLHALWVNGMQRTTPGSWRWNNEPDFIDVLRSFQKDRGESFGELLLEYAIARAFVGDRDDGIHLDATGWIGSAGRVRFESRFPWSSLPQWIRPTRPIEPTGGIYLWIDLKDVPKDASLGFRAEWDDPAVFRFALLRLGPDGQEIGKLAPLTPERSSSVEANLEHLDGAVAILVVGVNAGALAGEFRFDPDEAPPEPAGCMITLAAQR